MAYIRKRGEKWYYTLETTDENGKRKRLVRVGGKTKAECERAYRMAMIEKDKTGRLNDARKLKFSVFLDQWVEEVVEKKLTREHHKNLYGVNRKSYQARPWISSAG